MVRQNIRSQTGMHGCKFQKNNSNKQNFAHNKRINFTKSPKTKSQFIKMQHFNENGYALKFSN